MKRLMQTNDIRNMRSSNVWLLTVIRAYYRLQLKGYRPKLIVHLTTQSNWF